MASKGLGFAGIVLGVAAVALSGGVLGPAFAAASGIAAGTVATISTALWGASMLTGFVAAGAAAREQRAAANASLQDRSQTIRSTDEPRAILYGRGLVGGVLVYATKPYGTRRDKVSLVYDLVGHPCHDVEQIWINGGPVTLDGSGRVVSGRWAAGVVDATSQVVYAPLEYNPGTPTLNRVAPPEGATEVLSVAQMFSSGSGEGTAEWTALLEPGVDYEVQAGLFVVRKAGGAIVTGNQIVITYKGSFPVTGYVEVVKWTGHETGDARRDFELEGNSDGEWTATDTADGICRIRVEMAYDQNVFADGMPSLSALVAGKRVLDPRDGVTRFSDNAALCSYDYMRWSWGLGIPSARIPTALVTAAANRSDQPIPGDAADTPAKRVPQYTVNGFLSTLQDPLDNLDELAAAMGGWIAPSGNEWRMFAGGWDAPAADAILTDSNLRESYDVRPFQTGAELFNCVSGRYRNETTWQVDDFPPYRSAAYIAEDGGEEAWKPFDLPLTINPYRAQRLGKLHLHQARNALTFDGTFDLAAWRYQPGDRLRLRLSEAGWDTLVQDGGTGKVFRVKRRQWVYPDAVRLLLVEDTAATWSWSFTEVYDVDVTPNVGDLPSAGDVEEVVNFEGSASDADFFVAPDGTKVGFMRFTWDAITDSGVLAGGRLEIKWKRVDEPTWRTIAVSPFDREYRLEGLRNKEVINAAIYAVTGTGARSDATLIEGNVDGLANGVFSIENAVFVSAGGTLFSGNLLSNAAFEFDTEGWSAWSIVSGYPWSFAAPSGVDRLVGPPASNVMLYEGGASASVPAGGAIFVRPAAPFRVQPGERYGCAARWITDRCAAVCHIQWIDAAGSVIGLGSYGPLVDVVPPGGPAVLANYTRHAESTCFGTAPPNAVAAHPYFIKLGTKDGQAVSAAYMCEPMFFEIAGADATPPWSPGSGGLVTSRGIRLGAFSSRYVAPHNAAGFALAPPTVQFADYPLGSLVIDETGDVTISVTCEISASTGGVVKTIGAGIYQTAKLPLVERTVLTLQPSTSDTWTGTLSTTIPVTAGETVNPILRVTRSIFGLTQGNSTDACRKIDATFVHFKR